MEEIINKLSSYNLFNYLFPGAIVSILAKRLNLLEYPDDLVAQLLWFYFVGLVVSRIGSVVLEPLMRRCSFVKYEEYTKYLRACEADSKLEIMVEVANTYRTLAAAFAILPAAICYMWLATKVGISMDWQQRIIVVLMFVIFAVSFRKQVRFIAKRIQHFQGTHS